MSLFVTSVTHCVFCRALVPRVRSFSTSSAGSSTCAPQWLKSTGQFMGKLSSKNTTVTQRVYMIQGLKTNLLGLPAITALGLAVNAVEEMSANKVRKESPTVFQGLENLEDTYEIQLKAGATPYSLFTPRHVPIPLRPKVQAELERMESFGVIRKVVEPTQWCAGMVVAPKKEGAIRICVDLRPSMKTSFVSYTHFQKLTKYWPNSLETRCSPS